MKDKEIQSRLQDLENLKREYIKEIVEDHANYLNLKYCTKERAEYIEKAMPKIEKQWEKNLKQLRKNADFFVID